MKLLVSTRETQGQRCNDFCMAPEGEIVTYGINDSEMVGVSSLEGTTTFKVIEKDMTIEDLASIFVEHLIKAEWKDAPSKDLLRIAESDAYAILRVSDKFPEGSVLERRNHKFSARRMVKRG